MIPPDVLRQLRYIEVATAKKIRNRGSGPTRVRRAAPASTSTSIAATGPATTFVASTGT